MVTPKKPLKGTKNLKGIFYEMDVMKVICTHDFVFGLLEEPVEAFFVSLHSYVFIHMFH